MDVNYLISEYAKNPINNYEMKDFTIFQDQWNSICWDNIRVFLKIDDNWKIVDYSYTGEVAMITRAASSYLAELIIGRSIDDVLARDYDFMIQNWFQVSPRRKRAAVIAILAARNAIHKLKWDNKKDSFDELIEEY